MKRTNRIILVVICFLLLTISGIAGAQSQSKSCICLDENGNIYPTNTIGTVLCYKCTDEGCVLSGLTLSQCNALNRISGPSSEPVSPQPQQPVTPVQPSEIQVPVIPEPEISVPSVQPEPQYPAVPQPENTDPVNTQPEASAAGPIIIVNEEPEEPVTSDFSQFQPEPVIQIPTLPANEEYSIPVIPSVITSGNDPEPEILPDTVNEEPVTPVIPSLITSGNEPEPEIQPGSVNEEPVTPVIPSLITSGTDPEQDTLPDEESDIPVITGPVSVQPSDDPEPLPTESEEETGIPVIIPSDATPEPEITETETVTVTQEVSPTPESETAAPSPTPEVSLTPEEDVIESKLLFASATIEGKLDQLALSAPDGGTYTSTDITFTWVYTLQDTDNPTDVEFNLIMNIADKVTGNVTSSVTTISSASCASHICQYNAGSELSGYKKADIVWTVSGTFDDGGTEVTVFASNPDTLAFSLDVPDTPPTPEPKPAKPEAPILECPIGRYIVRSLGFYWAPSANAESYTVNWKDNKGHSGSMDLSDTDPTCLNGRCIVFGTMPGTGKYTWTVTAKNTLGTAVSKPMNFEIDTNITTPTAYRPNGTIVNRNYPSFEWEDVKDGAIEYRIQVVGKYDNVIRMDRWFDVKDLYIGNGVCYVKTDLFLPAGTYSWRVQARNADFSSGWSGWRDFYVDCDYCTYNGAYYNNYANTVPTTSFPTGTITQLNPTFQWRTLTGAAYYMVTLYDAKGQQLFSRQVSSSSCTLELCTWDPSYTMPGNGNYRWTVSGYGSNNALWNSASGSFTVQAAVVLKPIQFISPAPNTYLSLESPMIIWTDPGSTTAIFGVEIFDRNNKSLFSAVLNREQAWCDGTSCSIEFKTIPDAENYRITVTPYSELNTAGDTISLVFSKRSVSVQPLSLTAPKEGAAVTSRPLFRWLLENGSNAQYELTLIDGENFVRTYTPLVCGAEGVNCDEGEAFFSPSGSLPAGNYTARLSLSDGSAASRDIHFTIR